MVNRKQPVFLPLSLYPSAAVPQHCNHSASESARISGEARVPRGANGPRQQMAGPYGGDKFFILNAWATGAQVYRQDEALLSVMHAMLIYTLLIY